MSEFFEYVHTSRAYNISEYNNLEKRINFNNEKEQKTALQRFRDMINGSTHSALKDKSCCSDDNFLLRFLYVKKFQCESAMQLLIKYFLFKESNGALLQKLNIFDEKIQLALRDGNPVVLKQRDRKGRKIISFAASDWDISKYTLRDIYKAFLLTLDQLLDDVQNQALGFVVIVDWTDFSLKQSSHLSPVILKHMIEVLQNCMPVNFKGIHFISQPWYVDMALTTIKPFLSEKIRKRIMTHGTNLSTLHDVVSKEVLPSNLGGEGPSINNLDWYHFLLESSQISETPKSFKLTQITVYAKTSSINKMCEEKTQNDNVILKKNTS